MFSKKFLVGAGALAVCPFIIGCKDNGCKGDGCKNENFCGDLGYACPDGQVCMMGVDEKIGNKIVKIASR